MGMSQVFSARGPGGEDGLRLFKKALFRGGYLFGVGLIMLLVAMGPGVLWRWEILTLMGFATIILFFCRFFSSWSLVALSVAIAGITPYLRRRVDIAGEWGGALLCGIGALAILEIGIFFWERKGSKYSLEWILEVLTARIVPGYQRNRRT